MNETEIVEALGKPSRRKLKRIIVLAGFIVAGAIYSAVYPDSLPEPVRRPAAPALRVIEEILTEDQPGLYDVTKVIDGDTVEVEIDGRVDTVRLVGIDTPETQDPRKPVQCYGRAAQEKLAELVAGKEVRLEADPADSDRDKYRRLLRYVYLADGTFVNLELVRQGYAFAYTIFPNRHLEEFRAAEKDAKSAGRGLWAECIVDESKEVKQTDGRP